MRRDDGDDAEDSSPGGKERERPTKLEIEEELTASASRSKLGGSILHQASPEKRPRTPLKAPLHPLGEADGAVAAGASAAAGSATAAGMSRSAPPSKHGGLAATVRDVVTGAS